MVIIRLLHVYNLFRERDMLPCVFLSLSVFATRQIKLFAKCACSPVTARNEIIRPCRRLSRAPQPNNAVENAPRIVSRSSHIMTPPAIGGRAMLRDQCLFQASFLRGGKGGIPPPRKTYNFHPLPKRLPNCEL